MNTCLTPFYRNSYPRLRPWVMAAVLAGLSLTAVAKETALRFLAAGVPDSQILLPPPPLADSPEQAADLAEVGL